MPWFWKKSSKSPTPSPELAKVMDKIHGYQSVWQIVEPGLYDKTSSRRLDQIESRTTDGIWIQMKSDWSIHRGYHERSKTKHVCSVSIWDANYRPVISMYDGSFSLENNRRDCEYIDNYIHGVIQSIHAADSSRQALDRARREAEEQREKEQQDRTKLEQQVKKEFWES